MDYQDKIDAEVRSCNFLSTYLPTGIGRHFCGPFGLLRGVLGGRVGVKVELHHSCRIVLEQLSQAMVFSIEICRNGYNPPAFISVCTIC